MAEEDDSVKETYPQLKSDFNSLWEYQESSIKYAYGNLLNEVYNSTPFKILGASLIFHLAYLFYCLRFKWQYKTISELKYYLPGVRSYIGSLVGMLSAIICMKTVTASGESCMAAAYLALTSCILSTSAALLAYGVNGVPSLKTGVSILIVSIIITLPSLIVSPKPGKSFLAQNCVGLFHMIMAMIFLILNFRRTPNIPRIPRHFRNGHVD